MKQGEGNENAVLCRGDRREGEMSERAPDGGAVHLRAGSALPSWISWSRRAVIILFSLFFFQPELVKEEKKKLS